MLDYLFIVVLIIIASLIALVAMYVALHQPRLFLAGYLLLSTRMFGFLPMTVSVRVPFIMFFLHCAMILSVIVWFLRGRKFSSRMIVLFLVCVSSMTAFGVLYPYYLGFSNIRSAIVDGKEMFGYAALVYLAIHSRHFDFDYFLRFFCFAGIVLVAILIVGRVFDFCPPGYVRYGEARIIQVRHIMYISLAACLVAPRMLRPHISFPYAFLLLSLMGGLAIQGHRSVLLTTILAISVLYLVRARAHPAIKFVSILAVFPFLFGLYFMDNGRFYEVYFLQPISELKHSEGAIASRKYINAGRFEFIEQRPLLGYGFIDETSSLGWSINEQSVSSFNQTLGVVDSGYVDMLVRFGIVGTLFFCLVLGFVLLKRLRNVRSLGDGQLAMALFLSTYFLMNYTWSVFTYGFGISCVCVALFLLYSKESGEVQKKRTYDKI